MTEAVSQPISTPGSTLWTRLATEVGVARVALFAVALHIVDDAFLQPEPGVSAFDHPGALVPLGLVVGFAAFYPRLRAGARAALALVFGIFAIASGIEGVYYTLNGGPSGDDFTGWLSLAAGVVLVGLGAVTLWRTRRTDDRLRRRYLRRALLVVAALPRRVADHVPARHRAGRDARGARARPDARPRRASRERVVHDLGRPAARGLVRAVDERRDRDRRPGRSGPQKQTRMLVRNGYGVLLFDRRGEGASDGDPNIFGWGGERDLHAAAAYLQSRPDVDPERIGAIGLSVGGEMLIHAAAHSDAFKAVVSEGASAQSVRDELANPGTGGADCAISRRMTVLALSLVAAFTSEPPPTPLRDEVARIARPRVLHLRRARPGGRRAKPNHGFYAAAGEPKQIWEVPNGQHVAGITTEPEEYERRVVAFLDGALLGKEPR